MRMRKLALALGTFVLMTSVCVSGVSAETYQSIQARKPELFHPETGLRISRQRAPTPDDIPLSINVIDADRAASLIKQGALALDVFGALQSRYDELDGTWLVGNERLSIPGAIWLPEVGRGTLTPVMSAYLETNLKKLTAGKEDQPIVTFCVSDCWMSWNAAQRIKKLGYSNVSWFPLGTDGWLESGRKLEPVDPIPVDVE